MIVMKFGGTSIGNADRIRKAVAIVKSQEQENPLVVVSALGGVTDNLISIANSIASGRDSKKEMEDLLQRHYDTIKELGLDPAIIQNEVSGLTMLMDSISPDHSISLKVMDAVMSFGERMSSRIVAAHMTAIGADATAYDAFDIGMITDSNFGNADILPDTYANIRKSLKFTTPIPVITGFIGKDKQGDITTLGRGGSDFTACIIGAAFDVKEIEIWTNTDGVMTADPRIVDTAMNIKTLSYEEEFELESLGATNLNPKGIRPAMEKNIPVRILNTFNPEHKGTLIHKNARLKSRVASITYRTDINVINMSDPKIAREDFMKKITEVFDKHGVPITTLSTNNDTIYVTTDEKHDVKPIIEELGKISKINVMRDMAQISLVGNGLIYVPDITETLSTSLTGMKAEVLPSNNSKVNQSVVVKEKYMVKAIKLLHSIFFGR